MEDGLDRSLAEVAAALRGRSVSAAELVEGALERLARRDPLLQAYKHVDTGHARAQARRADEILARGDDPPPLCGIPISVKDLYGVEGLPTFAGTPRPLPEAWTRDAWLVARLRAQGAVVVGKTHMVELAYGGMGINPHWGTPRNPWDATAHRVPGGSSSGAGVSLWEGSALLALGSDTGGSIRIPASMTGTVGHKTTKGRWPTEGVVPLSTTFDTVGALTRSVEDCVYFFGAVDPRWGDPSALLAGPSSPTAPPPRLGVPRGGIWDDCQTDVADALHAALDELVEAGWSVVEVDGRLLDDAHALYMNGGIAGVECRAFLARELPGWMDLLHPIVGKRIEAAAARSPESYAQAIAEGRRMAAAAPALFEAVDLLALPAAIATPPRVADLDDMDSYVEANGVALRPTCPANMLRLCALSLPVALDRTGMPVGLQLVAPGDRDEALLGAALVAERALGTAVERLGRPPAVPD